MKLKLKVFIITFIIVSSAYLINITSSRYISEMNSTSDINVAIPQVELDTSSITTTDLMLPGETRDVEFSVKNYRDNESNEVLLDYYINLNITEQSIPLTYTIYEITENTEVELSQTSEGFGPVTLNFGSEEEKRFKIIFKWDEQYNDPSYASKQFKFEIEVNATQVVIGGKNEERY